MLLHSQWNVLMNQFASLLVVASLALAASSAAVAAEQDSVTLRVDRGSVMASQGGEFATANSGQVLVVGERLMVSENSSATVVYGNDCKREYTAPGVYVIDATCVKAAATGGTDWVGAAKIVGGVAVGAALLNGMEQTDAPPVSR